VGRRQLRELLLSLKEGGKTIFLSSHIVPDVEAVCDRVGILSGGKISKFLNLKEIYATKTNEIELTASGVTASQLASAAGSVEIVLSRREVVIARCNGDRVLEEVVSTVYRLGGSILEVKPLRFSLEDHLLETMTREAGVGKAVPKEQGELIHS
jgi:ABC-2 type transport system ATP-binding protein